VPGSTGRSAIEPLITIAITCYNAEDTIQRAVESASAQTWTAREIVIVDDGSTDRSATLLEELERTHDEIRVIRHASNHGVSRARNTLLAHARGTFIAFFDDDDESVPDRLERQYRRLSDYESTHAAATVLCYANRDVVRAGERHPTSHRVGIGRVSPAPSGPMVADYVLGLVKDDGRHSWGMLGSGTLMARADSLRALGGFDARFRRCAERDLAIRAALEGAHFISVDAPLIIQYLRTTADRADVNLRYRLQLVEKHRRYLEGKKAFMGAWCNVHAQYYLYRGRRWSWRLWYMAALVLFPWDVSREHLKHSSLLAWLGLFPARLTSS
jgi:glycosyltransferase involved in cell wall biosynthesis